MTRVTVKIPIKTYVAHRAVAWDSLNREGFNFGSSRFDLGDGVYRTLNEDEMILQPRPDIFRRDIWHCGSIVTAKKLVHAVVRHKDIKNLELKGKWVYVDFAAAGNKACELNGQPKDDRDKYRGR